MWERMKKERMGRMTAKARVYIDLYMSLALKDHTLATKWVFEEEWQ